MPFLVLPETAQASAAFAILSPFSSLTRTSARWVLSSYQGQSHPWVAPFGTTHACCAGEVERNVSNHMAHLARAGSSSDQRASWPKWRKNRSAYLDCRVTLK